MKYSAKATAMCALAAMFVFTSISPASAHENWHHQRYVGLGIFGAAVAVTAAVLTAPIVALEGPPQAYYTPYAPQPAYYPVYAAPQPVYYAPTYYAAPPMYYARY